MSQVTNADKNTAQLIDLTDQSSRPRFASVIEVKGKMVRVMLSGESIAGETWYPTSQPEARVGDTGVVHSLRGNEGYFQPVGMWPQSPKEGFLDSNTIASTTVISSAYANFVSLHATTLETIFPEIKEGTWDLKIDASALVYRSVSTGGIYLGVGTVGAGAFSLGRNFPQTAGYSLRRAWKMSGAVPTTPIIISYSGFSTAGTTYVVTWNAAVTATRSM